MLRGQDVICISSIDWDFIWQGHQQIMSTLAREGNRVLFIENTGVRAPNLRDLPRLQHRLRNWLRGTKGFRQVEEGLFVYSPLILPFPYSRPARWINRTLLLGALHRWMRATGFRRPLIWTFLPTPLAYDLIHALDPLVTVYYCIDDLASSSLYAQRIRRSEDTLVREVDFVFVTSEKLRQRALRYTSRVHLFPFGVDFEAFETERLCADPLPADLASCSRPIIGYVGGVHQWIDQELLEVAAQRLPHASFVLVGPWQTNVSRLSRQPNIHLLGPRTHQEVPKYVKGFDVGVVPYRSSEYTAHVYPTKLNEYLAMGIPVVATDLPEIRRFNADHGPVVMVAQNADEFVTHVRSAAGSNGEELIRSRIQVARQNSWQARIEHMSALIEARLAERQLAEERSWTESLLRLYRVARRRLLKMAVVVLVGYTALFHSPLVWLVASPLRVATPPQPVEAIVVFAGGVGESGKAAGGYQERVKEAVDLYQAGLAPAIIFSSGYTFVFKEAEVMKALAIDHGVPASAILLEEHAANTLENITRVKAILERYGWRRIILVSSPYHMRRALWTWRRHAPGVTVIPVPVQHSQFYAHSWGATLEQIRGILHEYAAILYYWLKGWV